MAPLPLRPGTEQQTQQRGPTQRCLVKFLKLTAAACLISMGASDATTCNIPEWCEPVQANNAPGGAALI